tara:strand:- start:231 stop:377 length:147 start_codon:yes stop_codon:yes gene_type:complete
MSSIEKIKNNECLFIKKILLVENDRIKPVKPKDINKMKLNLSILSHQF